MIKLIDCFESFISLELDWNSLLASSEESENVFLRHEWFHVWWQAFGSDKIMHILLDYEDDRLIGIAPLMISYDKYHNIPFKKLSFMEDPNAPSMNFIVDQKSTEKAIFHFIEYLSTHKKWHVAVLNKIGISSKSYSELIKVLNSQNKKYLLRASQDSPFIPVKGDYDAYLSKTSKKFKKQLRNKENKAFKSGEVKIKLYKNIGLDGKNLETIFKVSDRSWKKETGTSMVSSRERRMFFKQLSLIAEKKTGLECG